MTEQEAIKEFEERLAIADFKDDIPEYYEAMELAVKSLEEVQKYRAIGTVKEIKIREAQAKRLSEGYLTNLGILREYQSIGTPEECREAVEKQREVRNKAIDDFAEELMTNAESFQAEVNGIRVDLMTFDYFTEFIKEIAEQLKGGGVDEV